MMEKWNVGYDIMEHSEVFDSGCNRFLKNKPHSSNIPVLGYPERPSEALRPKVGGSA
jgi:hypothetical protein